MNRSHLQTKLGQTVTWMVGNKLVTVSTESSPAISNTGSSQHDDDDTDMQPLTTGNNAMNGDLIASKEAPGKLESSTSGVGSSSKSLRSRHKSSGQVLNKSSNKLLRKQSSLQS